MKGSGMTRRSARTAHTTSSRLPALPNSLLGIIFEKLEDGEDRCAFMHACKHLHNNQECLSKINRVTLFLDTPKHGTIHRQLSTVIPGSAITHIVVCGCLKTAMCVDERITFRSPAALPLLAAFSRSEHQQLLHQITHLELDEMCAIKESHNIRAFVLCLRDCMPNMKHLSVGSVQSGENVTFLLSELPQLQLESLKLMAAADDFGQQWNTKPGTGYLSRTDCFLLGQLVSLKNLTIGCRDIGGSFAPLRSLIHLDSFHEVQSGFKDDWQNTTGLNDFLSCTPHLTDLSVPVCALDWPPRSQSVRSIFVRHASMIKLPTRATLPSLTHLSNDSMSHTSGMRSDAQLAHTLEGWNNVSVSCKGGCVFGHAGERTSCSGVLQAFQSRNFVFGSVRYLQCVRVDIDFGQLAQLACIFPSVGSMLLMECYSYVPSELCMFSSLRLGLLSMAVPGINEDVRMHNPSAFARFCQDLLDACVAVQASRNGSLPPLDFLLSLTSGARSWQVAGLQRVQADWAAMLTASATPAQVRLRLEYKGSGVESDEGDSWEDFSGNEESDYEGSENEGSSQEMDASEDPSY